MIVVNSALVRTLLKLMVIEYSIVLFQIVASQLSQIGAKWAGITNLRQLLHIGK